MGLCYDLLTGPHGLRLAAGVVDECPETRFVLDHCGNIDPAVFRTGAGALPAGAGIRARWKRGIATLAERNNVVCKISGVMETGQPGQAGDEEYAAVINTCLDRFGPDRVMFASNWPVVNRGSSMRGWVELLRRVTGARPEIERRKLFCDNAMRFYRLT